MAVKDNGGVIGINLYPEFLNNSKEATIKDIINHIEYIASLAVLTILGLELILTVLTVCRQE